MSWLFHVCSGDKKKIVPLKCCVWENTFGCRCILLQFYKTYAILLTKLHLYVKLCQAFYLQVLNEKKRKDYNTSIRINNPNVHRIQRLDSDVVLWSKESKLEVLRSRKKIIASRNIRQGINENIFGIKTTKTRYVSKI